MSSTRTDLFYGVTTGSGFAMFTRDTVALPVGYASKSLIAGTLTLANQTFSTLGLIDGTYQINLPSNDFVRMVIDTSIAVPAPATLALMSLGIAGIGCRRPKKINAA